MSDLARAFKTSVAFCGSAIAEEELYRLFGPESTPDVAIRQ